MRMWRLRLLFLLMMGSGATICLAQQQGGRAEVHVPDGGQSGGMESIFVPPKAGAPFSLTLHTEWKRSLGNGGSITFANERRIVRDSVGRIFQERAALVPKNTNVKGFISTIQITDPAQHTWYNCIVATKVCDLYRYRLSTTDRFGPLRGGNYVDSGGSSQEEDLGVSSTQGEDTHGYKETNTLNPGQTGNDQPLVTVREFWYSARLAFNLISIVDNPFSGHQEFTVRELNTAEPDAALFEIPEGYTVADHLADDK
jgi:hypothetical protein